MTPWSIEPSQQEAVLAPGTLGGHLQRLAQDGSGDRRPALVVQGGGLRGIYSLAALAVLEQLNLRDAFSRVVGSSAGAINGAYFLAGQARESISIYTEDLSNRAFVNPWRFWRMVDVDYMVDEVLRKRHKLNQREMLAAPATLYTVLADAETAERAVISNRDPRLYSDPDVNIYELFRATAALPGLYDKRVDLFGRTYVDGGVAGLVPLDLARSSDPTGGGDDGADGTTPAETMVLLTRTHGYRKEPYSFVSRTVLHAALIWRQSEQVRKKLCQGDSSYNKFMDELKGERGKPIRDTWTLRPSDERRLVHRTTTDRDLLLDCVKLAQEDMLALLQEKHEAFVYA